MGDIFIASNDIRAIMHAIGEVHIEMATFPEHYLIAFRSAVVGMAGRIPITQVGFDFYNFSNEDSAPRMVYNVLAKKVFCDRYCGAKVERAREFLVRHDDVSVLICAIG